MSGDVIKLPLFAKLNALRELPGQERGRVFAVTEAISPQPEKSMGYLVEVVGGRKVKVRAWLALGGAAFACDGPLERRPDRDPDAGVARDGDEIFYYVSRQGRNSKVAHFNQRDSDGRLSVTDHARDLGPYLSGAYDIDVMGAACFLGNWLLPLERGEELSVLTVGDVLDDLLSAPYPDALDALGNTTAATGKGFAIGSAALTALALLASYIEEIRIGLIHNGVTMLEMSDGTMRFVQDASILDFMEYYRVSLMNPTVLIGVFIGAMMSFLFCGLTMNAVGRAAQSMVEEVRRQFREIKGILTGEGTPDYARCVAISTRGAQREMLFPSLLAIAAPVVVGLVFGVAGVMGLLVGGLSSGFVLAVFMANAGGAWDNAKKMVEEGHFGGKGSDCHRATVVGDTVGDPFKDTSGPSLNILIKLMSMVAIVMAGLTVAFHLF